MLDKIEIVFAIRMLYKFKQCNLVKNNQSKCSARIKLGYFCRFKAVLLQTNMEYLPSVQFSPLNSRVQRQKKPVARLIQVPPF